MKAIRVAAAMLFIASASSFAEAPSLGVYQILRQDAIGGQSELVLKVTNPPGRTYYVLGLHISDVPYVVEIEKEGKWIVLPQPEALSDAVLRPFLPDSYFVFEVPISFGKENVTFRVRAFLYTSSEQPRIYPGLPEYPIVELVTEPFSTSNFRAPLVHGSAPANDPGKAGNR